MTDDEEARRRFGFHLQLFRQRLGWSQKELHRRSGVSRGYIGKLETQGGDPSRDKVERLAAALGVTPEDLFGDGSLTERLALPSVATAPCACASPHAATSAGRPLPHDLDVQFVLRVSGDNLIAQLAHDGGVVLWQQRQAVVELGDDTLLPRNGNVVVVTMASEYTFTAWCPTENDTLTIHAHPRVQIKPKSDNGLVIA